ncbi:hypothetical protein M885DRAFT_543877 [Pelagophyceae sp. CCMP2097]|nr:hypothetical protein M885DRAFT_543877 [Pelagophyceae sp. CCMP2097]
MIRVSPRQDRVTALAEEPVPADEPRPHSSHGGHTLRAVAPCPTADPPPREPLYQALAHCGLLGESLNTPGAE